MSVYTSHAQCCIKTAGQIELVLGLEAVSVFSALEIFTIMRYINPHFTYFLIYLLTLGLSYAVLYGYSAIMETLSQTLNSAVFSAFSPVARRHLTGFLCIRSTASLVYHHTERPPLFATRRRRRAVRLRQPS